jgi:hypothetical protein
VEEAMEEKDDDIPEPVAFAQLPAKNQAAIRATMDHDPQEVIHHWSPKKIVSSYFDPQGNRRLTVLFSLTTGVVEEDNSGIEIKVTKGGWELTLSEKWDNFVLDVDLFYHTFPRDPRESDEEFLSRKVAMMNTVRMLRAHGHGSCLASIYRYKLPFRVDPTETRVTYIASVSGSRVAHIDLSERERVQLQKFNCVRPVKQRSSDSKDPVKFTSITE